jgi:hypothetical protein
MAPISRTVSACSTRPLRPIDAAMSMWNASVHPLVRPPPAARTTPRICRFVKEDGSFRLNLDFFDYCTDPARHRRGGAVSDRSAARSTGLTNLCLAVGLSSTASPTARVYVTALFNNIWVQPVAGDAGGAIGAAFSAFHLYQGQRRHLNRSLDGMPGADLGPEGARGPAAQDDRGRRRAVRAEHDSFRDPGRDMSTIRHASRPCTARPTRAFTRC